MTFFRKHEVLYSLGKTTLGSGMYGMATLLGMAGWTSLPFAGFCRGYGLLLSQFFHGRVLSGFAIWMPFLFACIILPGGPSGNGLGSIPS